MCQPRYSGSNCSTPLPIYGYSALDPVGGDGGDGALYAGNILDRSITPIMMMMVAGILISITILTGVTVYLFVRYRHRFQQMKHQQSSNYYSETGGGALDHLDQLSTGTMVVVIAVGERVVVDIMTVITLCTFHLPLIILPSSSLLTIPSWPRPGRW